MSQNTRPLGMCVTDASPITATLHHYAIHLDFTPLVGSGQQCSGCTHAQMQWMEAREAREAGLEVQVAA